MILDQRIPDIEVSWNSRYWDTFLTKRPDGRWHMKKKKKGKRAKLNGSCFNPIILSTEAVVDCPSTN